ncbi:MAG: 4'-phosphopantetheinyl transferase superfamily protein [Proteiniphilum sp.]
MLIRKEHIENGGLLGIWRIEESREELLEYFPGNLRQEAIAYTDGIRSPMRSIEWLSTRAMLFVLLGDDKSIQNHPDGRPYLTDHSYHISLSHTKEYAALLLHDSLPVGIDIEARSERVKKVASKFISEEEYIDPSRKVIHQLLHWSAKESLFKLINRQGVDFKEHLRVRPFTPGDNGTIMATETGGETPRAHLLHYEVHDHYVLTWVVGGGTPE